MTTTNPAPKKPSGEEVAQKAQEASKLRAALEKAALDGPLDYTNAEVRAAHERLDALERWLYTVRRRG